MLAIKRVMVMMNTILIRGIAPLGFVFDVVNTDIIIVTAPMKMMVNSRSELVPQLVITIVLDVGELGIITIVTKHEMGREI